MSKRKMRTRKTSTAHKNGVNCYTVGQAQSARLLEETRRSRPAPKWLREAWELGERKEG